VGIAEWGGGYASVKLILATREQETFEQAFALQIASFRKVRPDVEIEIVPRPISQHYVEMMVNRGRADLFLCCTDWLPAAVAQGVIEPIDPEIIPDWPEGWHPAMQKLVVQNDQFIGLPWHDGPQMFLYRKDIFEDPTHREKYRTITGNELRPPQTWDEFLLVAKFFTHPENDEWGCVCAGLTDGHNNVYDFLIHLWSRGGELLDSQNRPVFDSEIAVEALTFYRDLYHLHKVISPKCLGMGSVESGDFFAEGNAAMMWNWCGFAAVCELPESKIRGNVGITSLPGGVSLNIYWALTVPKNCENKEAAYAFLSHVSSKECDKITSMVGANGTRLSTWRDLEVRAKYPHYEIIEEVHSGTLTLPAIPEYTQINDCISEAVDAVIHHGADVRTALRAAVEKSRKVMA
jgi:multiple sugar transport system substrate-binding protein